MWKEGCIGERIPPSLSNMKNLLKERLGQKSTNVKNGGNSLWELWKNVDRAEQVKIYEALLYQTIMKLPATRQKVAHHTNFVQ